MAKLDRLGWAASSTFRIGNHHIGIRSSTVEADDLLRRLLATYLVTDVEAPANYSLRLGGDAKVGRELSQVYRSSTCIVRRRTAGLAVLGLLHELCRHQPQDPDGLLRARVTVLLQPRGAALLPHPARDTLVTTSSHLPRGVALVDAPFARLDPSTAQLVDGLPTLSLEPSALAELRRWPGLEELPATASYQPIESWSFFGTDQADMTRARAVALAAATLLNVGQVGGQPSLDALAQVFRTIDPSLVPSVEPEALRRALRNQTRRRSQDP